MKLLRRYVPQAKVLAAALLLAGATMAQSQAPQAPTPRQDRRQKTDSKQLEKAESDETSSVLQESMRQTLDELSKQISLLSAELRKLRKDTDRTSGMLELLVYEERLAKLEDKIQDALDHKAQLDAREQDLQRRTKNIQQELLFRGGLRRDEAEAAARADLQRALDDVHAQQSVYHQRISELQTQAERVRARTELLRKRLEPAEDNKDPH